MARIGRFRHRVKIVTVTVGQGDTGAPEEVWVEGDTVWAEVRTVAGSEQLEQPLEQVGTSTIFRVTMRYRRDIRPTMVLLWQDAEGAMVVERALEVRSISEPDNRQRILQLDCTEEF